jgi:hypothetical protein
LPGHIFQGEFDMAKARCKRKVVPKNKALKRAPENKDFVSLNIGKDDKINTYKEFSNGHGRKELF